MEHVTRLLAAYKDQSMTRKIIFGSLAILLLGSVCIVPIAVFRFVSKSSQVPVARATSTIQVNITIIDVQPTATAAKGVGLLAGLTATDIVQRLEKQGFFCPAANMGQGYFFRACDKTEATYSVHVEIYGQDSSSVDYIKSTVLQFSKPDNEFAVSFLGSMAAMSYDNALPDEAKEWVEKTIPNLKGQGDVREVTFGEVNFRLYGLPTAITLEMGNPP